MIVEPEIFVDGIEEILIKGKGAWIATFKDFHRNYKLSNKTFLLYAEGDTFVKGFFFSKIFSYLVSPRRKAYFLVNYVNNLTDEHYRKIINICYNIGSEDDYILLVILTGDSDIKGSIKRKIGTIGEGKIGISIFSLTSGKRYYSNNFLGKSLKNIVDKGFEFSSIYIEDLVKAISIILITSMLILIGLHFFGIIILSLITILADIVLSLILGYILYRRIYHTVVTFTVDGFIIKRGRWIYRGRWRDFNKLWLHVERDDEYIRIEGREGYVDIPTRRIGANKYTLMNFIKKKILR